MIIYVEMVDRSSQAAQGEKNPNQDSGRLAGPCP
jgi:hypothetical protein